jgi:outer membrane protein TolC
MFRGPLTLLVAVAFLAGCQSPSSYRRQADGVAGEIVAAKQEEALGRTEPFTIETPAITLRRLLITEQDLPRAAALSLGIDQLEPIEHWPEEDYPQVQRGDETGGVPWKVADPLLLTLLEALQTGARNNREYQNRKEEIFRTALDLDLERDDFRNTFAGLLEGLVESGGVGGERISGAGVTGEGSVTRRLKSGAELTGRIAVDLVKLLTGDRSSSLGLFGDATVSIPLLRGAGSHIVTEPLTQAERDMVYVIWEFERFKREFAVQVASAYLGVLQREQEVKNSEENYRGLIVSTRRARRLAESGRLPWFQYDQALQNELRARNRWISAEVSHVRRLDFLKGLLGLPTDARILLDRGELERLAEAARKALGPVRRRGEDDEVPPADAPVILREAEEGKKGPFEMETEEALRLALESRLDMRVALGRVYDAQRKVVVAADALRAEMTLFGSAEVGERRSPGSAGLQDAALVLDEGRFAAFLNVDLPLERTAERNLYRESFIGLQRAVRGVQELEDEVKLEVRDRLRNLLEFRESIQIQAQAVDIAERRVKSTDLFLQAGRAEIRDVLDSQEALLSTQNALTSALVGYRIAELELQRDLGVLEVDEKGLWKEFSPREELDEPT